MEGNTDSDIPAFTKTYQPFTQSSRFVENGSFVRLKNVSLAYNVPSSVFRDKANIRIFASATNLFTITKYKGYDPEIGMVNYGGTVMAGIDTGRYPSVRMYSFGLLADF